MAIEGNQGKHTERPDARPIVTLRLFSGIRNPRWILTETQARSFARKLKELPKAPSNTQPFEAWSWYDGFVVTRPDASPVIVFAELAYEPDLRVVKRDRHRKLEQFLWSTIPENELVRLGKPMFEQLSKPLDEIFVIDGIEGQTKKKRTTAGLPCASAPRYPGATGVWKRKQSDNNCYNYGNDEPALFGMSALPGAHDVAVHTIASLRTAAEADKLVFMGPTIPTACPVQSDAHYTAICLRKQFGQVRDFHCLRMDRTGRWSHKDGSRKVRNTDDRGKRIVDLRTAHWKLEMELVGFFLSIDDVRTIRAPEDP